MRTRLWATSVLLASVATGASAQQCTCTKYPFGPSACIDTCAARLLNTAPFSEIFEVLDLPGEAQDEILADETSATPPDSLSGYSEATQQAIRNGLAGADPAALERLFSTGN